MCCMLEVGRRRCLVTIASNPQTRGMQSTVDHMQSCPPKYRLKILTDFGASIASKVVKINEINSVDGLSSDVSMGFVPINHKI